MEEKKPAHSPWKENFVVSRRGKSFKSVFSRAIFNDSELNCAAVSFGHDGGINILNVVSPFDRLSNRTELRGICLHSALKVVYLSKKELCALRIVDSADLLHAVYGVQIDGSIWSY